MPESVGVDVGQIMALGEAVKPRADAVRIHGTSVISDEHKTGFLPAVSVGKLQLQVPVPVLTKKIYGFRRERNQPDIAGLGGALKYAASRRIKKGAVNADLPVIQIQLLPFEADDLSAPAACDNQQMDS